MRWPEIAGAALLWIFATIAIAEWFALNKMERDLTREELRGDALQRDLIHALKRSDSSE